MYTQFAQDLVPWQVKRAKTPHGAAALMLDDSICFRGPSEHGTERAGGMVLFCVSGRCEENDEIKKFRGNPPTAMHPRTAPAEWIINDLFYLHLRYPKR